jgi:UDPglucose 6-dehydrogenase
MLLSDARHIAIVGCGHVGAISAACFTRLGHRVTGIDIDVAAIEGLCRGRSAVHEAGFEELLVEGICSGRLDFTSSFEDGLADAEVVFLCVSTPPTVTGAADLRNVRAAVKEIARALKGRAPLPVIVNKSTAPIGTGETIESIFMRSFEPSNSRPPIVSNPEFLREGSAVADFFAPDRIVVGAEDRIAAEQVAALYSGIEAPVLLTDLRTAEMIKYVSNAFLATRVSFINEIARLCEAVAIDVEDVVKGVSLDSRIGSHYLRPGIGYGGSCLPKDVAALAHTGDSAGIAMRLLAAVQETNLSQRKHAVNCLRRLLGTLDGKRIAVWGGTFKGDTEDTRESPALDVIQLLRNEGAEIALYDPALTRIEPDLAPTALDAVEGADALAVLSDWPSFTEIPAFEIQRRMAGRVVFDGRNILSRKEVQDAGLTYYGVGRPPGHDSSTVVTSCAV